MVLTVTKQFSHETLLLQFSNSPPEERPYLLPERKHDGLISWSDKIKVAAVHVNPLGGLLAITMDELTCFVVTERYDSLRIIHVHALGL